MKKLLSVLLVVVMMITSLSTGLVGFAESGAAPNAISDVSFSAYPTQDRYEWGDQIYFNVDVTNNGSETLKNLVVEATPRRGTYFWASDGSDKATIDSLAPGETKTVQVMFTAEKMPFFVRMLILPILSLIDSVWSVAFNAGTFGGIVTTAKVGLFPYRFAFEVKQGEAAETDSIEFLDFSADTCDIKVNETVDVTFFASVKSEITIEKLELCSDEDTFVAYMYDDGSHSDEVANDGVYTAKVSLNSSSRKLVYYYSKFENVKSYTCLINFYQSFTDEEYQELDDFNAGLSRIIAKRTKTDNDEVNLELAKAAYNEILDYINQQKENGVVSSYTINSSGIIVNDNNNFT